MSRYLGNEGTMEVHDIINIKENCKIIEIKLNTEDLSIQTHWSKHTKKDLITVRGVWVILKDNCKN